MQTIGERLEEARKKKGISIREAAEATKIRGDYLQKFESNHFDIGLTEIYTRGFLRTYANFLKVPADRLLNDYAALGRGETRPRSPNREVYGRMDITVATAGESSDRASPPGEEPASPETPRPQPRYPRGGSSLPSGPDPALIFKYAKWAGIVVAVVLVAVMALSFFSDGEANSPIQSAPAAASANADKKRVVVTALANVRIQVWEKLPNARPEESYGAVLLPERALARGETASFTKTGSFFIHATAVENIQIDVSGGKPILPGERGYKGDMAIEIK